MDEKKPRKPKIPWRQLLGEEHYLLLLRDFESIRAKAKSRKGKPDELDRIEIEMDKLFQNHYKKFLD